MKTLFYTQILIFFHLFSFAQAIDTTVVAKEVDSLIQLSRKLTGEQKFDDALLIIKNAQKKALDVFGKNHPIYAICLFNQARNFHYMNRYSEAEVLYFEAKDIQEKTLGNQHPDYANSLNNLGSLYQSMKQYKKAESFYLEVKSIRKKILGEEHTSYIAILNNLGILYNEMNLYNVAEPFLLEVKMLREKTLGKTHPDYIKSLSNLASLYDDMNRYDAAETFYLEAKATWEKNLNKGHPEYAGNLHNLAHLYMKIGRYKTAETFYLEARNSWKTLFSKEHPNYALTINALAVLYWRMGNYEAAESFFLEAKAIREKILSQEHPDYATSLSSLASFYLATGRYEMAEPLYLKVKIIREKVLGKEHRDYIGNLHNLGVLYMTMGSYEMAEPLLLEAQTIRKKNLDKQPLNYAESLNTLGALYASKNRCDLAEPLFLEAKSIQEKVLGKEHPDYAQSLNNLSILYEKTGRPEAAEPLFRETQTIREQVLGKEHPSYAQSLNNLANFYWKTNQLKKIQPLLVESAPIQKSFLLKATRYLSEQELGSYTRLFANNLNQYFSFAQFINDDNFIATCFDQTLFYKGFLLTSSNRVRHLATTDSTSQKQFEILTSYHRRLSAEYTKPIVERKAVAEMETKANELEKELRRTVAGFGEALRQVTWEEVKSKLKANEAAIEFIHFRYYSPNPTDSTLYAALVLRPEWEYPKWVFLFEEKQLDQMLNTSLEANIHQSVQKLYTPKLYDLIWRPLEPMLTGVDKIYYSPDGLLHRINFVAIPVDDKRRMMDFRQLHYVSSTRNLVVDKTSTKELISSAMVYGGLKYSFDTTDLRLAYTGDSRGVASNTSLVPKDTLTRSRIWRELPKSEVERVRLVRLLRKNGIQTSTLKASAGTEESFKNIGQLKVPADVIHLATHGYFFSDEKIDKAQWNEYLTGGQANFRFSDNPLLRSGLILAGGNKAWTEGLNLIGREDGILTAYEIAQMNLSKIKLVVLSACETGLGEIQGSEGVYGLQRAFRLAGVDHLIMTLWSIPDSDETVEFMETFYKYWLNKKLPIQEAFNQTQRKMRKRHTDPYYWAGFVLIE